MFQGGYSSFKSMWHMRFRWHQQTSATCRWRRQAWRYAGSELMGGRFWCLKYCTTCWGSSASTALASVSLGACRQKEKRNTNIRSLQGLSEGLPSSATQERLAQMPKKEDEQSQRSAAGLSPAPDSGISFNTPLKPAL